MREIRVHPPGTDLQRIVEPNPRKSAPPVQVRLSVSSNRSNCDQWFGPIAVHLASQICIVLGLILIVQVVIKSMDLLRDYHQ